MAKLRRDDQRARAHGTALTPPPAAVGPSTVETPRGPAAVHIDAGHAPAKCLLVLGHGAGGDVDAPDLVAVRDAVVPYGVTVVRVTQPYRVAGRRAPAPAGQLDEAFTAVVSALRHKPELARLPLVLGGRSSGARVACRTAGALGAKGVVALAFPEHPPGKPETSRSDELRTGVPTLVVNGDRDPFGVPQPDSAVIVELVVGADHGLKRDPDQAGALVLEWLRARRWARRSRR